MKGTKYGSAIWLIASGKYCSRWAEATQKDSISPGNPPIREYALAEAVRVSGPIAMVMAGLLIGNHGRQFAMSSATVERLDLFWELVDEILNAILFVLLGIEVLVLRITGTGLAAGAIAVGVVLVARFLSVAIPIWLLRRWQAFERGTVAILTWGGLRGGLAVAMALSLPSERSIMRLCPSAR